MKIMLQNSIAIIAFLLFTSISYAQILDEKILTDKNGYGEKELKKAPKKVYIASFAGYFNVAAERTATSQGGRQVGGGSYSGDTKTYMGVAIDNVDSEDFMEIVDEAYQQFLEGLKSQGYEIISPEVAGSTEYYSEWTKKNGGRISSTQLNGYVMAIPTGFEYYVKKETKKGKEKTTFVDKTMMLSKELDNALIAEASFVFKTIDMDAKGGAYSGGSKVKATINFRMVPAAGDGSASGVAYSRVKFVSGKGPGISAKAYAVSSIKKEVPIEGVFADTKFKESTRASSSPAYYGVVFTANKSTKVTHTAAADNAAYKGKSKQAISELITFGLGNLKEKAGN